MTDEQIMIDGVDVAGCEHYGYRGKAGYWCHNYDEPCTDNPNCVYKQLKRKEQELADLKEFCEKLKKSNSNYATAVLKSNLKLEKIKEKWQELINMSPLELATNAKKMLELDNIIKGEENE
jgi:predicted nuclease with TOPRIM domain